MADKDWMQDAVKKPGSLRETAKKHGAITRQGTIAVSWLDKAASGAYGEKTAQRAHLAKTFRKYNK